MVLNLPGEKKWWINPFSVYGRVTRNRAVHFADKCVVVGESVSVEFAADRLVSALQLPPELFPQLV